MAVYFFVYFILVLFYLLSLKLEFNKRTRNFILLFLFLILLIFIGFRDKVGADWSAYLFWYNNINKNGIAFDIARLVSHNAGYDIINYISSRLKLGIYGVNVICAFLFLSGLFYFIIKELHNPFFGLLVVYPSLIMVVAMNYVRQSVALGFVFLVYVYLLENKLYKAGICSILSMGFHKTGAVSFLLLPFNRDFFKKRLLLWLISLGVMVALVTGFVGRAFLRFYRMYIINYMISEGAFLRAITVFIPAVLIIIFNKKLDKRFSDQRFWFRVAMVAVLLSFFSFAKFTFADRMLLYFYPVQIVGFERSIDVSDNVSWKILVILGVVLYSFLYIFVWLSMAVHRVSWIPYRNFLWELLF